ncbi:MAG: hypothetical protein L0Y75_03535 [Acidobacteria bacterium]|nr:hypothetical protein [Acidobacteriota bacterium]
MRKTILGLAALILTMVIQSAAFAQVDQFEGDWENVNPATSGVTKLDINVFTLFGIKLVSVRAWGQCHPTDCDWGSVIATKYAPSVSSDIDDTARALIATYNPGFAVKTMIIKPLRGGRLQAEVFTRFTDGSGRSNYNATYIFKREGVGNDCLTYNPNSLRIVDEGPSGWLLTDGRSRMLILDNQHDAEKALALARRYTAHCFIGRDNTRPNRDDYVHEYWLGESGVETVIPNEDCISYNPDTLRIVDEGANGFLLTDGFSRMAMYASREDAEEGLRVAKLNTKQCFIGRNNGRPNRKDYIVEYWK